MLLTKEVLKAGRALLDWTQQELADKAGLHIGTIARFEAGTGMHAENRERIATVMQEAGISFIVGPDTSTTATGVIHASAAPNVIKAGRALLDWTQKDLSDNTGLPITTIVQLEAGAVINVPASETIQEIMEAAGLAFIQDGELLIGITKTVEIKENQ